MVYKKKKYYNRRNKKYLKASNIFSKKNASSQAKQIYALNKKIKYIERSTKPEVNIYHGLVLNHDGSQQLPIEWGRANLIFDQMKVDNVFNGSLCRVQNYSFYGCLGLKSTNNTINITSLNLMYVRIVICKYIADSQIPHSYNPFYIDTGLQAIKGPLVDNITTKMKVLSDKVYKITPYNPNRLFKYYGKGVSYRIQEGQSGYGKGEIAVYYAIYRPFSMQASSSQILLPEYNLHIRAKVAYVDDC